MEIGEVSGMGAPGSANASSAPFHSIRSRDWMDIRNGSESNLCSIADQDTWATLSDTS